MFPRMLSATAGTRYAAGVVFAQWKLSNVLTTTPIDELERAVKLNIHEK